MYEVVMGSRFGSQIVGTGIKKFQLFCYGSDGHIKEDYEMFLALGIRP